jgi:hypothetical protein
MRLEVWRSGTFLAALLFAVPTFAQAPTESAGELFVRARSLMKAGDCVNALPILEQSHALDPKLGTKLNLAICETRTGKLVEAAEHLRSVVESSPPADDRRVYAERALQELVPRIPNLIVELDVENQTLETVRLDGEVRPGLEANKPFAINPGEHAIEVVLTNQPEQGRRFSVGERQTYTWSLSSVGQLSRVEGPAVVRAAESPTNRPAREPVPSSIWTTQREAAVVAGVVSLASFGVATGFALSARSIYASSDPECSANDVCSTDGVELRDQARERGRIATVALTVGIASAFATGTLWITGGPRTATSTSALRAGFRATGPAGERGASVVVQGQY